MPAFETLLGKIVRALEKNGISYMVIGGQAVLIHGKPRFTGDIDITLGVNTDHAEEMFTMVRALSLKPRKYATKEFVRRNSLLKVEDPKTGMTVDFIFSSLPYERQAIQRAVPVTIGKASVRFATAEDTIIHKLFAGRPLDIADVKGIVNMRRDLDKVYLKKWLKEFSGVANRNLLKEYNAIESELKG